MRRPCNRRCADRFVDQVAFDRNPAIEMPRRPERRCRVPVAEHGFCPRAGRQRVGQRQTSEDEAFTSDRQLKRAKPTLKKRPNRSCDVRDIGRPGNHPGAAHVPASRKERLEITPGASLAATIVADTYDLGRKRKRAGPPSNLKAVAAAQGGQNAGQPEKFPTAAEIEARIEGSASRRGVGNLFLAGNNRPIARLEPMSKRPTLLEFYEKRFKVAGAYNHVLQSATRAMKTGMTEEVIFACLMHDVVQALIKVDHGWWGAQMFEPYVPEKSAFAIRYHQTLRFFPDEQAGYEYPDQYYRIFGHDYTPPQYIQDTYKMLKNHKWYMEPRLVTVNDLYAFDPNAKVSIEPFKDIIGRHFKQPKEGLGYDNSPSAHMWRTLARPDNPL